MMQKIRSWSTRAYVAGMDLVRSLKEDERGLSGVVVAVLLILIAVLGISFLWGNLSEWIDNRWTDITKETFAPINPQSPK